MSFRTEATHVARFVFNWCTLCACRELVFMVQMTSEAGTTEMTETTETTMMTAEMTETTIEMAAEKSVARQMMMRMMIWISTGGYALTQPALWIDTCAITQFMGRACLRVQKVLITALEDNSFSESSLAPETWDSLAGINTRSHY
jgi:hypothetical protein